MKNKHLILLIIILLIWNANYTYSQENQEDYRKYSSLELDSIPRYKHGNDSLFAYLNKNAGFIRDQFDFEGYIYIILCVNCKGRIEDIFLSEKIYERLFLERIKIVFSKLDEWIPGKINDNLVSTCICIPFAITMK